MIRCHDLRLEVADREHGAPVGEPAMPSLRIAPGTSQLGRNRKTWIEQKHFCSAPKTRHSHEAKLARFGEHDRAPPLFFRVFPLVFGRNPRLHPRLGY
jgi:hypothetical protein